MPRMAAEGAEGSILLRQGPGFRARWRFVVITADHRLIDSGSQILFLVLAQDTLLARHSPGRL